MGALIEATAPASADEIAREAARRRTFAIISHPDAGKTTLSEKLLLYGGAVSEAGSVKARANRREVVSDWMEIERQRGISVTSTVMRFEFDGAAINLLDTPGHRDFSEDTLRVLGAADSAVILLDAAKGIEERTLKLFEVARERHIPLITFINKFDRPGLEPLALMDEIESTLGLFPTPVTWPVGPAGEFEGVIDRRSDTFHRFERTSGGSSVGAEQRLSRGEAEAAGGEGWEVAQEELALLEGSAPTSTYPAISRVSRRRCSSVRRSPTSACDCSSTRSSRPLRRLGRGPPRAGRHARRNLRSPPSSSRSSPTSTRAIGTGSHSSASVQAASSAG